jgi:predicted chitinase/LysM repeat protein
VRNGDYLNKIAADNGMTLVELLSINENLNSFTSITAGQIICLSRGSITPLPDSFTTKPIIQTTVLNTDTKTTTNSVDNTAKALLIQYNVMNGDNCLSIAMKYCMTIDSLIDLNKNIKCYDLKEGSILNVTILSNTVNLVTQQEFENAFITTGYPKPTFEKYQNFITYAAPYACITTKRELAMFLAQLLWESGGLQYMEELYCISQGCEGHYVTEDDYPDQQYYGRGYIQLTWAYNYKAASLSLYNDLRLYTNPELVSQSDSISWAVSFWYWKQHVHYVDGTQAGHFGVTTKAINGFLECFDGPYEYKARIRFEIYSQVLKAFNLYEQPIENGCY